MPDSKATVKRLLRPLVPESVRHWRFRRATIRTRKAYAGRPVRETFVDIYHGNVWGGTAGEFFSGGGSDDSTTPEYIRAVNRFISEHDDVASLVDLGCGDFRVGSMLTSGVSYVGVDIVPDLIDHNTDRYGGDRVQFQCLNMIEDTLPPGDLGLIRQVLQHLSNEQVGRVLAACRRYKYLIVTEHQPSPHRGNVPNLDKPVGPDTRLADRSGIYIDLPPFNRDIAEVLCETVVTDPPGVIRTFLLNQ